MSSRVFVLGAGGYIGEGVAKAFRRHGFRVHGLVRNAAKAKELLKNEIEPVVASVEDVEAYKELLASCSIIVDAVGFGENTDVFVKAVEEAAKTRNSQDAHPLYKPLFIFTSGIMTYGNATDGLIDETVRPKPMLPDMEDRRQFENKLLSNFSVLYHPVVVRPGFVYGGHGGHIADMFLNIDVNADLQLDGRPDKRWSWVHIDDLGEGYVAIAKAPITTVSHQQYNLAAPGDNPNYQELRVALAKEAGWDEKKHKIVIRQPSPDAIRVLNWEANVIINPERAIHQLGWKPHHHGLLVEIDTVYRAWKAHK